MAVTQSYPWFHSNPYGADAVCNCGGIIRHESWCITSNARVMNAWESVLDAAKLSLHDRLILHALGVLWCNGC